MAKPTIICVDDEKIVLDSLKKEIKGAFSDMLSIEVAESGEEALEIIQELIEDKVDIPIIISDFIMPQMKGDEFLIESKNLLPNTKRIMLTGQATNEGVGNAMINAGLYRFIAKPWNNEDLELTVTEAFKSFYKDKKLEVQESKLADLNRNLEKRIEEKTKEIIDKNEKIKLLLDETVKGIVYSLVQLIARSEEQFLSKSLRLRNMSKSIAEELFPEKIWDIEIAALLSHLGCLNLEADLKKRYFAGEILSQVENNRIRQHISDSSDFLEKIPMFENIALGIKNVFYSTENINSDATSSNISTISRVLRIVNDYDNYILTGKDKESALNHLINNSRLYDYSIFKTFEGIVRNIKEDKIEKAAVRIKDVKIGMKLADEVTDIQGNIIIKKNEEINQSNIQLLTRLYRKNQVVEPLFIVKTEA